MTPVVSIVTPVRNGERYIGQTLGSVAAQTFLDYEHIIVDDGSSDAGPSIVAAAAARDDRIRLVFNNGAHGAGPARSLAMALARGRYIAFLDADDLWDPDKLSRQIAAMQERGLAFSWTGYRVIGADGATLRSLAAPAHASVASLLSKRATIGCLSVVYDAKRLGLRAMPAVPMHEDFRLWLEILRDCERLGFEVGAVCAELASYRVHAGGMTKKKWRAAWWQWRAYRDHAGLSVAASAALFVSYAARGVLARCPLRIGQRQAAKAAR